jgi:uncharacterized protein (DUF302 family)
VKKLVIGISIGVVIGVVLCALLMVSVFPKMMLLVDKSNYDFEETYSKLENSILEHDWDIQRVYEIQECMSHYGYDGMKKLSIFSFCKANYVNEILKDDKDKRVSAIMPCRISVYETNDGEVYISRMNIGLMSKLFGGKIEEVMAKVAAEEASIVERIIRQKEK